MASWFSYKYKLIQEPGPITKVHITKHDLKLPKHLNHIEVPDGYIVKEGQWMVFRHPYYIQYPGGCENAIEFEGCDVKLKWFVSKMYLTRIPPIIEIIR